MNPRVIGVIFLISMMIVSCGIFQENQIVKDKNFPLDMLWSIDLDAPVYKLATTNEVVAVGTADGVKTINVDTGKWLWNFEFPLDTDSLLAFTEKNLVAADSINKQIVIIGPEGNEIKRFGLASTEDFQVLAVYSSYIFVRRVPSWNLEVYDLNVGVRTWQILVDRGNVSIGFDPSSSITYITTSSFVGAYDITSGNEIWKFYKETRTGVFDSGVLYYYSEGTENNINTSQISAVDVQNVNHLWSIGVPLKVRTVVYNLTILNDLLIASTDYGLIALSITDGHEIWHSETNEFVYGKLIMINGIIYARGTNTRVVYAISPDDGSYLGYLELGTPPLLATSQRDNDILYKSGNCLIFTFENTIYGYQIK